MRSCLKCHGSPAKMFPCVFPSRKLNSAERNYDVGDRELLAMKAAFEEWRHWLDGTHQPFTVPTDHRNQEYIRSAKRLNACQAHWSLFFSRFNFKITYRLGSKNGKADALSCQFDSPSEPSKPEPILPSTLILAPVQWDIISEVTASQQEHRAQPECPADSLFVPPELLNHVLLCVHCTPSAGHPGISATIQLVSSRFWWPTLQTDVIKFLHQCTTCNTVKSSNLKPAGLLQPLPVPQRPWSHIAVDHSLKDSVLSSQSLIASLSPVVLSCWLVFPLPSRQLKHSSIMCSVSLVSPRTSSPTVVPSSLPMSGKNLLQAQHQCQPHLWIPPSDQRAG